MKIPVIFPALFVFFLAISCQQEKSIQKATITLDHSVITGTINEMVYGHFYEHIYHSANGGLWGDLIWNRSFEEFPSGGKWSIDNGVLKQTNLDSDIKLIFGDPEWTDYELNLEAKKTSGYEAFLVLFRARDEENFYWYNIGGWGNSRHALEKEVKNNREVLTDDMQGSIVKDRWYKIRIRCKGNNFKAWIDDEQVLDYTDETGTHLKGAVGLGSWSTEVNYRNIKVSSLTREDLFTGLPELPEDIILPRHWVSRGEAVTSPEKNDPLNSEFCLKFKKSNRASGIYQYDISVKAENNYNGSIWIKGSKSDTLIVRLEDNHEKLAENILTGFSSEWKEYPIHFLPLKTTDKAVIGLIPVTQSSFYIDQLSLMAEESEKNDGFRTDLYEAVNALAPPVIRWPGGCFAELYRWKDGVGMQHERGVFPVNMWDDKDVNSLGTDEFLTLCRKLGSEPLIVVNSGFHEGAGTPAEWAPWIEEACDWIEYCNGPVDSFWGSKRAENGHPEPYNVKLWEIDNELWRSRVPDARIYSEAVKLFSAAMKKTDPSITIIAHGGNGTDERWNNILIENSAEYFDILSVHHYMDPDKFDEGVDLQEKFYLNTEKTIAGSRNPGIKLYVSEWNAQSTDWRTGLYAGGLFNAFERCGDFLTIGGPALFLRHTSANAWDNAFINFDHTGWFPAPNYVVMKLWRENYAPNRIKSECDDVDINHVATLSESGNAVICKIVNPVNESKMVHITLPENQNASDAVLQIISAGSLSSRNTMESPGLIAPREAKIRIKKNILSFEMPAYSCGVAVINCKL